MDEIKTLSWWSARGGRASRDARETCFGVTANPSFRGVILNVGGLEVREAGEGVAEVEGGVDAPAATTVQNRVEDGAAAAGVRMPYKAEELTSPGG